MAGTENASSALAVWNALKPKIRQLIRDETRSAVRKKKMTIQSIDTANQSVTVYEAANPNVTLTLQYRKESGVGAMSAGQSVTVEWIYDDLSTAVVSGPGQGWSTNTLDAETAGEMFISSNNPTLTWTVGSTGSTELRNSGPTGSVGVSFVTKATSDSSVVFQTLVNGDGTQNWVPPTRTVNGKVLSANITLSASDVNAAPVANPILYWGLKSNNTGNPVTTYPRIRLARTGGDNSWGLAFVYSSASGSNVYNNIFDSSGNRLYALKSEIPDMATKTLSNQTTSTAGSIDLGLTTSAAAVLGCANSSYIMIPFVNSGGWRVRAIDNAGNRVVSTNVGTVTVYYLAL